MWIPSFSSRKARAGDWLREAASALDITGERMSQLFQSKGTGPHKTSFDLRMQILEAHFMNGANSSLLWREVARALYTLLSRDNIQHVENRVY